MKSEAKLVSILIVNYNGFEVLDPCLTSLGKSTYPNFEVIVVDNGSTDGSAEKVEKKYKEVTLVKAGKNLGFAGGNNLALKSASGKYIVLLNGDTEVEPDWLDRLVKFAEKTPDAGVFASKVLFFDNKKVLNSAGGCCDIYGFSPLRGTFDKDIGQYDKQETVFYAHGAAMMVRRSLIEKIGFLDEDYFIYHEEMDFCWRTWISGSKVYYVPEAVAYHKLSQRNFYAKEKRAKRQFLVKKNRISTLIKNHKSVFLLLISLLANFVVSLGETVLYVLKGDFETPKGTFSAYWWNIKHLSKDLNKRKKIQRLYKAKEKDVLKQMQKVPFAFDILVGIFTGKYSLPL